MIPKQDCVMKQVLATKHLHFLVSYSRVKDIGVEKISSPAKIADERVLEGEGDKIKYGTKITSQTLEASAEL